MEDLANMALALALTRTMLSFPYRADAADPAVTLASFKVVGFSGDVTVKSNAAGRFAKLPVLDQDVCWASLPTLVV